MTYKNEFSRQLTSEDIKIIKATNDSVCGVFRATGIVDCFNEDHGQMALRLNITKKVYGKSVKFEHTIPVSGRVESYGNYGRNDSNFNPDRGFSYTNAPQYSQKWRTFVDFIRKGDVISFLWRSDNNNQYLEYAKLHHDEFFIVVERGNKKYSFFINSGTCRQNSGRMLSMGDNNQYLEYAKLHNDEFFIVVERGNKKYSFFIDSGTCRQNSGRMLQMGDHNYNAPNYDYDMPERN